jgi:hypothetical protein
MEKCDPFGSVLTQPTKLIKVADFFTLPLCPRGKVSERTALSWSTVTVWYGGDTIVDVELDKLFWL